MSEVSSPKAIVEVLATALSFISQAPNSESELQDQIEDAFKQRGVEYLREVRTATGPVDFMVGEAAIEIKVKGSPVEVMRQIVRYLADDRFTQAILITTKPMRLPMDHVNTIHGKKPVFVIDLWRQFI